MEDLKIRTMADIQAYSEVALEKRLDVFNTYDMLAKGAAINPDAPAISFIMSAEAYDQPLQVTYREFIAQINRTANFFHDLGIGTKDVISYLLPNLPQTHYVLWAGEAAGIVNPIFGPDPHAGEIPVAFIQLQEGADLTEEQILAHLQKEVGERAAIPKQVTIVEQIPLTPVDKIFKPALRWEATRQLYQQELQALSGLAESVKVTVAEDKIHGSLVTITIKAAAGSSPD